MKSKNPSFIDKSAVSFSNPHSNSSDPFRNTNRLKAHINRLNETLLSKANTSSFQRKSQISFDEMNKKEENLAIIEKVRNTKKKLKIYSLSKEKKLNNKLQDFKKMDTFFDIQKFLKDFNILEDPEFKEFYSTLKANLKEYRIKKPLFVEKSEISSKVEDLLFMQDKKFMIFIHKPKKKNQ